MQKKNLFKTNIYVSFFAHESIQKQMTPNWIALYFGTSKTWARLKRLLFKIKTDPKRIINNGLKE